MSIQQFGRFFLPGPTEVRPEVLEAMQGPMIGHRDPPMVELMRSIQPRLKAVFRTERPVWIAPSSGTGMMEAGVRNLAGERVLALVNGAFSERFRRIAEANGRDVTPLEVPWGEAHTRELLVAALREAEYDAITVCHSETSTGVLNPVGELAAAVREAGGDALLLVDGVSSIAGAPLETDLDRIDYVLTGSQKAFALPPGLAFGVAQPRALERAERTRNRGVYFDFVEFEKNIAKHQTPNTPAVSLLYALDAQLRRIEEERDEETGATGIEARWHRHRRMAERTYRWVDEMRERGLEMRVLAPDAHRSPTVTCISAPDGWTGPRVAAAALEAGYTITTGYGRAKEGSFRIGHMGDHTVAELEGLLAVLSEALLRRRVEARA